VIPTDIRNEVNQMIVNGIAKEPCDAIGKLVDEAKSIANKKAKKQEIRRS
jgi:hypothetical protein